MNNKDLLEKRFTILHVLVPFLRMKNVSGVMYVVFINECKSYEISNQMFFNVIFSFSKAKEELDITK